MAYSMKLNNTPAGIAEPVTRKILFFYLFFLCIINGENRKNLYCLNDKA